MNTSSADADSDLSPSETAIARSHTYVLASRLFKNGLTPESYAIVADIPELAGQITLPIDVEVGAAHHQRLFDFDVFPHESVFLAADGLLGGATSQEVTDSYTRAGFSMSLTDSAPDHICQELDFLAYLCAAESVARQRGDQVRASAWQRTQSAFLDRHLWRWLSPFTQAVVGSGAPFYGALAEMTCRLAADHLSAADSLPEPAFSLPESAVELDAPHTSLADIAELLVRPARCGFFLSRTDLVTLGRDLNLPTGFGGRKQLLLNLMRAAIAFGHFPELMDKCKALAGDRHNAYGLQVHQLPTTAKYTEPWRERTAHIMVLLADAGRLTIERLRQVETSN